MEPEKKINPELKKEAANDEEPENVSGGGLLDLNPYGIKSGTKMSCPCGYGTTWSGDYVGHLNVRAAIKIP